MPPNKDFFKFLASFDWKPVEEAQFIMSKLRREGKEISFSKVLRQALKEWIEKRKHLLN